MNSTQNPFAALAEDYVPPTPVKPASAKPKTVQPVTMHPLYKTELCAHYEKHGRCKAGGSCAYAHGAKQLRPKPVQTPKPKSTPKPSPADNPHYKTVLCENFKDGECKYGEHCMFAHGDNELREKPRNERRRPQPSKPMLCDWLDAAQVRTTPTVTKTVIVIDDEEDFPPLPNVKVVHMPKPAVVVKPDTNDDDLPELEPLADAAREVILNVQAPAFVPGGLNPNAPEFVPGGFLTVVQVVEAVLADE